jgi:chemotaxis methyl-accepting protein methylase
MTRTDHSSDGEILEDLYAMILEAAEVPADPSKLAVVHAAILKRLQRVGLQGLKDYRLYFEEHYDVECAFFASIISPHHTGFFRESVQFQYIDKWLPSVIAAKNGSSDSMISVWCVGCSHGHEAYSLAMYLHHKLGTLDKRFDFSILAADIDSNCISNGKMGIYPKSDLVKVPVMYLGNHWTKSGEGQNVAVAASQSLRQKIEWQVMDVKKPGVLLKDKKFDLIVCRNVLSQFDRTDVDRCLDLFLLHLNDNGRLLIGSAESISFENILSQNYGDNVFGHRLSTSDAKSYRLDESKKIIKKSASG